MEENIDKSLLERFVSGSTSPEETAMVNRFLALPEGKLMLKEFFREQWLQASDADVDERAMAHWEAKLRKRLNIAEETEMKRQRINKLGFRRYAAVWALIVLSIGALGIWWFTQKDEGAAYPEMAMIEKMTPKGRRSSFMLSDGTRVILGPGSTLRHPTTFSKNRREVQLYGEAYFEVTKNPDKPFIVHTGDIRTEVLGTSFKINGYEGEPLWISVATGKVRVDRWANGKAVQELAILNPGEGIAYHKADHTVQASVFPISDITQWKGGHVVFNGRPFHQLIKEIDRWYDVQVICKKNHLYNESVTVTLDTDAPLRELLNSLSAIMGFSYELDGRQVTIN